MSQEYVDTTLLDGYAGGPHVTEEQVGLVNQGLYGAEDYVLGVGRKAEAQILTNNSIRIFDAVYVIQGRRDVINVNGYQDVSIANGSQGMNRNDIIVRRYVKDESSEIEKTSYAVIKGAPTTGAAIDPKVTIGDIKNGATLHEMVLYRVRLNGLNIVGIDTLFKTLVNMFEIQKMLADSNSKISNKIEKYKMGVNIPAEPTGEFLGSKPIYIKMVDIGAMPNATAKTVGTGITDADYFWIDPGNSLIFSPGASYPMPYADPANINNSVTCRLGGGGTTLTVQTGTSWSGYSGIAAVKYTKKEKA